MSIGKYDIGKLKSEWESSVGNVSGISFEVALLLAEKPEDVQALISSKEESMRVLSDVKKKYEKAQKILKWAKQFRKYSPGYGALSNEQIEANRRAGGSVPPNMRGITEHFTKSVVHNQFNYKELNPLGVYGGIVGRKPLPPNQYPMVLFDQAFANAQIADVARQKSDMDRAEMAFHATRNNRNWDDYLTGRTGDWSGYDPSSGPLGDLYRKQSSKDMKSRAMDFAYGETSRYEREDLERQRKERADRQKESRLSASRNSIAVRRRQVDAYRRSPWLKTLVDSGIIQKKNLPEIAKTLKRIEKVPIIGKFVKHPVALAALAGIGAVSSYLDKSNQANKEVTEWRDLENLFGIPSKEFSVIAGKAGVSKKDDQAKLWGKLTMAFGDPMNLKHIGKMISSAPDIVRMNFASKYGLSATDMAVIDVLSKERRGASLSSQGSRITKSRLDLLEQAEKIGFATGSTAYQQLDAAALWLPGVKSVEARTGWYEKYIRPAIQLIMDQKLREYDLFSGNYGQGVDKSLSAREAAESLNRWEKGEFMGFGREYQPFGTNNSMAVYITNFNAQTNNVDDLKKSLIDEGRSHDRLGVVDSMDTRIKR